MVSLEHQSTLTAWWKCDCWAWLGTSVPFCPQAAAGAQGEAFNGGQAPLPGMRLFQGCCLPVLGEQGLLGMGRQGSHVLSSRPPNAPLHAAGSCCVAPRLPPRHGCHACCPQLDTQASATPQQPPGANQPFPPPFPIITRAPNGVLLHPGLQRQQERAHHGAPASRVPSTPAGLAELGWEGRLQLCWLPALAADR